MLRNEDGTINPQKPEIGGIILDASISETHTYDSEVPQFPVENGLSITDTVINKPISFTVSGIVSTTPIQGDITPDPGRADRAYQDMIQIREKREEVTIVTPLSVYEDMVMTNLTVPRSRTTGESFEFSASFIQILKADVAVITIEKIAPPSVVPAAQVQMSEFLNGGKALVTAVAQAKAAPFIATFNALKSKFGG
jgi:hypothetical protein